MAIIYILPGIISIAFVTIISFIIDVFTKDITKFKRYLNDLNISYTEVGSTIRLNNKIFTFDEKGKIVKE